MSVHAFEQAQQRALRHYGVQARSRRVEVSGVEDDAHVLVAGQGPPVVLVTGADTPAAMWAPLLAELSGFTLYAVDRPGCGLTGSMAHTTRALRGQAVRFLAEVLDGLGLERPLFIGNSMGSQWILWFALEHPGRVAAAVHVGTPALILGTSAPLPMRLLSIPPLGRLLMKLQPPSERQMDQVAAMVRVELFREPLVRAAMLAGAKLPGHGEAFIALLHACLQLRGARPPVALTAELLSRLTQPMQLIWADDDPFGSVAVGQRAAALIPDAEFHVVSGGGHAPWINRGREVGGLAVPFLQRHAAGALARQAASA